MPATPLEHGAYAMHPTPSSLLSARSVPCGRHTGLTVKAQCLSNCLPPRYPNSLWFCYRLRMVGIHLLDTSWTNESGAERIAMLLPLHLSQISGRLKKCARQQPWWSGMHCTPSWLQGCARCYVNHNPLVEYKRPCSWYFPQEWSLLRVTRKQGSKPVQAVWREREELLFELLGWELIQAKANTIWFPYRYLLLAAVHIDT